MGYEESLRQAKNLLVEEIDGLREQLARKELSLKKLNSFLKEPHGYDDNGISLTCYIVELVYRLVLAEGEPVTAKAVVQEFYRNRSDVNESTIRSTLYQVSRKQKPTCIQHKNARVAVQIIKDGPTYNVKIIENDHKENIKVQANA